MLTKPGLSGHKTESLLLWRMIQQTIKAGRRRQEREREEAERKREEAERKRKEAEHKVLAEQEEEERNKYTEAWQKHQREWEEKKRARLAGTLSASGSLSYERNGASAI